VRAALQEGAHEGLVLLAKAGIEPQADRAELVAASPPSPA
jgi:hypothetical protein